MADDRWISWMPSWVESSTVGRFDITAAAGEEPRWRCLRPHPEGWVPLGDGLRTAQRRLSKMPVAGIVAAIHTTAKLWTDRNYEPRRRARDEVRGATGFSAEAVDRSFDFELRNYLADSLENTLQRELGGARALDGWVSDQHLRGRTMAIGPRITLAIFSGNVPGLPALSIVRALLVKSAVIAKVASGEPTFAARFAQTLAEVEPTLGEAIVVTYWDRQDVVSLRGALGQVDAVIAYGGDEACAAVRTELSPHHRYLEHGHKISVGLISRSYLEQGGPDVARRIAIDVSTFNQHACIAPQVYFVEGDAASARSLGQQTAEALEVYAHTCPLGQLSEADASSLQLRRASAAWAAASRPSLDFWRSGGLDWTVMLEKDLGSLSGSGNRVVRIVPVKDLDEALLHLRPIARNLQNVGLGATGEEFAHISHELARIGACRICEPGRMAEPSLMWRHDGEACVARLVRWCDVEMHHELNSSQL